MLEETSSIAYACGYSEDGSGGVFSYRVDTESGELDNFGRIPVDGASFLAVHPEHTYVYAITRFEKGFVIAYRRDEETGELTEVNHQPTGGKSPCYVSVNSAGSHVFVANGSDSTIAVFPIRDGGGVEKSTQCIKHEGSSVDPERQQSPHPHSIDTSPNDRFVYVPDLGTDQVVIYRATRTDGVLQLEAIEQVALHGGAGPRHFEFHPNGQYLFLINELDSSISAYDYDPETGMLSEIMNASTLPDDYHGDNLCADIHVHPSGQWIFGSNRGHDSIAIFAVDETDGSISLVGQESTRGHWPRHFMLDPEGRYLYVENRRSDSVVTFEINRESGELKFVREQTSLPEPVCLRFIPEK
ncbi:lactonase family protein [Haloferax sp. YSMS24]|uniref:lactonase family protein n=1 Tax=Haloferax sp. YSMS24 TaxID=3388425 RepID=UPI00398CD464